MKKVAHATITLLQSKPLVQTDLVEGVLLALQDALTASDVFRDATGELLITEGEHIRRVRSNTYSKESSRILAEMGAGPLRISDFVEELNRYISQDIRSFSSETGAWHSRVARLLYNHFSYGRNRPYSREYLAFSALQIIPLEGGLWVSGNWCNVTKVFLDQNHRRDLPTGLDFCFVQPWAADDHDRRQLYRLLGARPCDETEMCRMIVDYHAAARTGRPKDLITHAVYLFHARYQPQLGQPLRICLIDSSLTVRYQDRVHLPFGTEGTAVRRLFSDDFSGIIWLHSDYRDAVTEGERQDWYRFLSMLEGVYLLPPLQSQGRLSDAMRHILRTNGSLKFLGHLKMRHGLHVGDILSDMHDNEARVVREDICNIEVSTDRGLRKLRETIVPSLSNVSLGLLPVLQLNDPDDTDWKFLRKFGVQTERSPDLFLKQLRSLKAGNSQEHVKDLATTVYKAIAAYPGLERSKM